VPHGPSGALEPGRTVRLGRAAPCITPSTETCVVVVSFTIAPLLLPFDTHSAVLYPRRPGENPQVPSRWESPPEGRRLTSALDTTRRSRDLTRYVVSFPDAMSHIPDSDWVDVATDAACSTGRITLQESGDRTAVGAQTPDRGRSANPVPISGSGTPESAYRSPSRSRGQRHCRWWARRETCVRDEAGEVGRGPPFVTQPAPLVAPQGTGTRQPAPPSCSSGTGTRCSSGNRHSTTRPPRRSSGNRHSTTGSASLLLREPALDNRLRSSLL